MGGKKTVNRRDGRKKLRKISRKLKHLVMEKLKALEVSPKETPLG